MRTAWRAEIPPRRADAESLRVLMCFTRIAASAFYRAYFPPALLMRRENGVIRVVDICRVLRAMKEV